ncbi:hypothetical protein BGZ99_000927 [Dissophora globulifera]|uniref:Secreted protein n=1 Tax=Dissophora globulifera TaxID=979702 RepID=A0A9P6UYA4_9FUNG|nr:hypothetical protein BGZ99_000927 [Dissophora globulifera]
MLHLTRLGLTATVYLALWFNSVDAKRYTKPYDCYVVFGKIQRCYDGRSNDLTRCVISSRLPSDQTAYTPRSMGGQAYMFGTSTVTLQTVEGYAEKVEVATFRGVCEDE